MEARSTEAENAELRARLARMKNRRLGGRIFVSGPDGLVCLRGQCCPWCPLGLFWWKNRWRFLVYLVVESSTRAIYIYIYTYIYIYICPKRTPMVLPDVNVCSASVLVLASPITEINQGQVWEHPARIPCITSLHRPPPVCIPYMHHWQCQRANLTPDLASPPRPPLF